jgi:hypothetical protein
MDDQRPTFREIPQLPAARAEGGQRLRGGARIYIRVHIDENRYGKKASLQYLAVDDDKLDHASRAWITTEQRTLLAELVFAKSADAALVLCKTIAFVPRGGNAVPKDAEIEIVDSYLDNKPVTGAKVILDNGKMERAGDLIIKLGAFGNPGDATDTRPLHHLLDLQVSAVFDATKHFVDPLIIVVPRRR